MSLPPKYQMVRSEYGVRIIGLEPWVPYEVVGLVGCLLSGLPNLSMAFLESPLLQCGGLHKMIWWSQFLSCWTKCPCLIEMFTGLFQSIASQHQKWRDISRALNGIPGREAKDCMGHGDWYILSPIDQAEDMLESSVGETLTTIDPFGF